MGRWFTPTDEGWAVRFPSTGAVCVRGAGAADESRGGVITLPDREAVTLRCATCAYRVHQGGLT